MRDAVGYILHHQNKDGGWPAYERARAPEWISLLNRSDVFGKVSDKAFIAPPLENPEPPAH